MEKKIKHFSSSAEEVLKQQQEAFREVFRKATASPLEGVLKQPQEAFRKIAVNPVEEFLKPQEAIIKAVVNPTEKIFKDLLKPMNYLEEQVKATNIAVLGKDYFNITAFSAIRAIEGQRDFFIKHSTPEW